MQRTPSTSQPPTGDRREEKVSQACLEGIERGAGTRSRAAPARGAIAEVPRRGGHLPPLLLGGRPRSVMASACVILVRRCGGKLRPDGRGGFVCGPCRNAG